MSRPKHLSRNIVKLILLATISFLVIMPFPRSLAASSTISTPSGNSTTPSSFAFNFTGYNLQANNDTLSSYESWLQSWGVSGTSNYLYNQPTGFTFLQYCYQHSCVNSTTTYYPIINVEVYMFANTTVAQKEFTSQYPYKTSGLCGLVCPPGSPTSSPGPILKRFVTWNAAHTSYTAFATQQLVQRSNFVFFFYSVGPGFKLPNSTVSMIMWNFVNSYIGDIFSTVPEDAAPSSPPTNIPASNPAWGLRVGDNITWNVKTSGCVGDVLSGGTCSNNNYNVNLTVVAVADNTKAVEVRGPSQHGWPSDFGEGGDFNYYGSIHPGPLPTMSYSWVTGGTPFKDPLGSNFPLLYPYYSVSDLETTVMSSTVSVNFTNDAQYLTGTYQPPNYQGFTPIETQNERIVVHMGSGVVTSITFYYNNNQNAITTSDTITLLSTSFNLASRLPMTTSVIMTSTSMHSSSSASTSSHSTSSTSTGTSSNTNPISSTSTTNTVTPGPTNYTAYAIVGVVAVVVVGALAMLVRRKP